MKKYIISIIDKLMCERERKREVNLLTTLEGVVLFNSQTQQCSSLWIQLIQLKKLNFL